MKKLWVVVGLLFASGAMAGCAAPRYDYVPQVQAISRPPLGAVSTVGVGEQMLLQGRIVEREALRLDEQVRVGAIGTYTFSPGHYVRVGTGDGVGFFNESALEGSGRVTTGAITDPFQVIEFNPTTGQLCGVSIFNAKVCTEHRGARLVMVTSQGDDSFQQTLIYSGRVGNKINVGYREFSSNMARPAFNNDVEYDLSESMIIGYRGAEIEVIEATNRSITYRVIKNFNEAAQ